MRKFALVTLLLALVSSFALAQDGDKVVTFWHIQNTGTGPELIQNAVDRYMADNPDVTVEVIPMQNDPYKTRIRTAIGAGDAPCVFPSWGGGPMIEYVNAGQIIDLTDYIMADGYNERFLPASFSNVTYEDSIYGLPVENIAVAVMYYNTAIFDEYGLEVPETWDELLEVAQTLIDNGVAPFSLAGASKWTSSMYYMYLVDRIAGPQVFADAANREGGSFENEAFVQAGQMIQDLVEMGAFVDGFNGLDYDTGQSRIPMYAGQAAMELMGTWQIATYLAENPDFYENQLGFFAFPAVEGGAGDPSNVVGTVGDNYYHIGTNCEYPDEAFEMLTYLIDDTSVEERVAAGRIPPVVGVSGMLEDPVLQDVIAMVEEASAVQLWYDQYLPPELGEVHKDTMQSLFGLDMTPEEAAAAQEEAVAEFYAE